MKAADAKRRIIETLSPIYGEPEAAAIASLAMESIIGVNENASATALDLTTGQKDQFESYLRRLAAHEPVQYVTNTAWFYNLRFFVENHVLIPRPETEELVHWIIGEETKRANTNTDSTFKILDVGTGSGCIALALKKHLDAAEVWGCDKSDDALNVARRNGADLDVRVDFVALNFLDENARKQLPAFDIIVSNPPYIPSAEENSIADNVKKYEPHMALFVLDEDALVFYREIIHFANTSLKPGGKIYLEIHEARGKETVDMLVRHGYSTELRQDMQGKERMIKAWKD